MIAIAAVHIGFEEKERVLRVLESGALAQGNQVAAFEEAFAAYIGTRYAVATSSGTTALHLALLAHGIGRGDEVITTPFTFIASANAILYCGATPVFADIDAQTFNIDPVSIMAKITPRTKAILPVHLYGLPAPMPAIRAIAERFGLAIIEDACQAHGATINNQRAGSFATGCFSFYPTKNMTCGEGGMVTTDDPQIAEQVRLLRAHGMRVRYYHDMLGYNFRMTDIHAAIGLGQLARLDENNRARAANAAYFSTHLQNVSVPAIPEGYGHVFHQYTIRVPAERDAIVAELTKRGIGTGVYYPVPVHRQNVYRERGFTDSLPVAEEASKVVISLPVHPALTETDRTAIVAAVNDAVTFLRSEALAVS